MTLKWHCGLLHLHCEPHLQLALRLVSRGPVMLLSDASSSGGLLMKVFPRPRVDNACMELCTRCALHSPTRLCHPAYIQLRNAWQPLRHMQWCTQCRHIRSVEVLQLVSISRCQRCFQAAWQAWAGTCGVASTVMQLLCWPYLQCLVRDPARTDDGPGCPSSCSQVTCLWWRAAC